MDLRKHALEAVTLIAAAILCALVANTVASRERKLVLVGTYPNATKVPPPAPETATAPPMTESTAVTTTTAAPATGTVVSVPASTTTTSAPTTTTTTQQPVPTATQPRNPATPQPGHPATQQPSNPATQQPVTQQPSNPQTQQPGNPATASAKYTPHPDKPYIEIAYKDVAALYAGGALFLDARRTNVYEQGHIAGARPFSVWESDADDKVKGLWEQRQDPKEQALPIVIYCTGGDCEDSHMLAQKLWGAQFSNIYVYKDGFPDWQAKGGAIHTGAQP
jgi:rhodanese-related sulfurtransferase